MGRQNADRMAAGNGLVLLVADDDKVITGVCRDVAESVGLRVLEAGTAEEAGDRDDALQTNTLAELYLRQGLVDRAVEVYRSMLRVDPNNQRAARRLADLSPPAAGDPGAATAPGHEITTGMPAPAAPARFERPAPVAAPSAGPGAPRQDHRIHRLERWLERVRSGSAGRANPR